MQIADAQELAFDSDHHKDLNPFVLDVSDGKALRLALEGRDGVISYLDLQVAQAAVDVGVNYFDPTEDVQTARGIRKLAKGAKSVFIPQCGLAPGFIAQIAVAVVNCMALQLLLACSPASPPYIFLA